MHCEPRTQTWRSFLRCSSICHHGSSVNVDKQRGNGGMPARREGASRRASSQILLTLTTSCFLICLPLTPFVVMLSSLSSCWVNASLTPCHPTHQPWGSNPSECRCGQTCVCAPRAGPFAAAHPASASGSVARSYGNRPLISRLCYGSLRFPSPPICLPLSPAKPQRKCNNTACEVIRPTVAG
jgi:hypothetical protein